MAALLKGETASFQLETPLTVEAGSRRPVGVSATGAGRGRQGEEATLVEAVRRHGREAKLIARDLGTGRSIGDVKKYYQKHKKCGPPSPLQLRTHACTHAATHARMHARTHARTHSPQVCDRRGSRHVPSTG